MPDSTPLMHINSNSITDSFNSYALVIMYRFELYYIMISIRRSDTKMCPTLKVTTVVKCLYRCIKRAAYTVINARAL